MADLKDALEERKARTRPLKEFNKTVTELEERIQLDEDVESALIEMREAFNVVSNLHRAYLAARQGSASEEYNDDPQDVKWMDKVKASRGGLGGPSGPPPVPCLLPPLYDHIRGGKFVTNIFI